ncbi:MAG: hypothetical protein BBJ57_06655 [Desulfobacterales bacterium PC51MH44]|nr:MAG: hypothetical protein BBJ57_06655 [Desulfobacterales bacterium PC51MH44]
MNSYQKEQAETLSMVRRHLASISAPERRGLESQVSEYLVFRDEVDAFLSKHFSNICTQKCYQSKVSACCSREGIITFFGDMVINALVSPDAEIKTLMTVLQKPNTGFKCIYLGNYGCVWRVKPIVCEMFLCKQAKKEVFKQKPWAEEVWKELKRRKKLYTWPDRPVLFDALERYFMDAGYSSPLMYLHNSPGLLSIKRKAKQDIQSRSDCIS